MFICALSALIVQIEEQLTKRRLERDERRRAQKEEHKKLERLEKLMAAFKKKQRSEAEKVRGAGHTYYCINETCSHQDLDMDLF